MSAVHRVDDIDSMPAPRFFQFAWRLPHYQGVIRDRVLAMQARQEGDGAPPARNAPRPASPRRRPGAARPVTKDVLADPLMAKIFSFA